MAIKGITLKESMNRSVQAIMPLDDEKEVFNQKLVSYLTHLKDKEDESEEYQKNPQVVVELTHGDLYNI